MLAALLNGNVRTKLFLGKRMEGEAIVAGRLIEVIASLLSCSGGEVSLPVSLRSAHLLLQLGTKPAINVLT